MEMSDIRDPAETASISQRLKQFEINKAQKHSSGNTYEDHSSDDFQPRDRRPLLTRYPPPKTTIAAFLLTLGGIIFLSLGFSILYSHLLTHGKDKGLALIILGGISKMFYWLYFVFVLFSLCFL
jgi:hypothetical protein